MTDYYNVHLDPLGRGPKAPPPPPPPPPAGPPTSFYPSTGGGGPMFPDKTFGGPRPPMVPPIASTACHGRPSAQSAHHMHSPSPRSTRSAPQTIRPRPRPQYDDEGAVPPSPLQIYRSSSSSGISVQRDGPVMQPHHRHPPSCRSAPCVGPYPQYAASERGYGRDSRGDSRHVCGRSCRSYPIPPRASSEPYQNRYDDRSSHRMVRSESDARYCDYSASSRYGRDRDYEPPLSPLSIPEDVSPQNTEAAYSGFPERPPAPSPYYSYSERGGCDLKGPYRHNPHSRSGDPVPRQVVYPNEEMLGCDDYFGGYARPPPPPPPPMDRRDDYSGSSTIYTASMYSPSQHQYERQGPPTYPYTGVDIPGTPPMPDTVRPPLHSQQTNRVVQVERERRQSAARHQILKEIAQATHMWRSATTDGDRRFWERQIDTLNESFRKL